MEQAFQVLKVKIKLNKQTKDTNALLKLYLRHYVSANKQDWANVLDMTQFSYSLQKNKSTNLNPFEIVIRWKLMILNLLVRSYIGKSITAYKFAKSWHKQANITCTYLCNMSKTMK